MTDQILFFKRYPLEQGRKIHILDGPRRGDWLVEEVDEKKVRLLCPVSGRRVEWDRFCYFVEQREAEWPARE
jgi:hypothetical protein